MDDITFEKIQQANTLTTSVKIKGRSYTEVNQRLKAFRSVFPTGSIQTQILQNSDGVCIIQAFVRVKINGEDILLGTGIACEKESASIINETSFIENCETSAVGRALGMCGFGIDTSIASADEITTAIRKKGAKAPSKTEDKPADTDQRFRIKFLKLCKEEKLNAKEWLENKGFSSTNPPSETDFKNAIFEIQSPKK